MGKKKYVTQTSVDICYAFWPNHVANDNYMHYERECSEKRKPISNNAIYLIWLFSLSFSRLLRWCLFDFNIIGIRNDDGHFKEILHFIVVRCQQWHLCCPMLWTDENVYFLRSNWCSFIFLSRLNTNSGDNAASKHHNCYYSSSVVWIFFFFFAQFIHIDKWMCCILLIYHFPINYFFFFPNAERTN